MMNNSIKEFIFAGFLKPIQRHKGIFLVCLSLSLLLWAGAMVFISPIYESHALLQVGLVQGGPIEEVAVFVGKLDKVYPRLTRVERVSLRLVRLTTRAGSAEKAQKDLIGITDHILNEHTENFRNHYQPHLDYQKYLKNELIGITRELDEFGKMLEASDKSSQVDPIMVHLQKVGLRQGLLKLKDKYFRHSNNLLEDHWQETVLLQDPTYPGSPLRPKPLLYLGFALTLGIALGLFSVFYANSLVHETQRLHDKEH